MCVAGMLSVYCWFVVYIFLVYVVGILSLYCQFSVDIVWYIAGILLV